MLVCERCGKRWDQERDPHIAERLGPDPGMQGLAWWQVGQQLQTTDGEPARHLSYRRDFCSEACIRAYYQQAGSDHDTRRLPALAKRG